MKQQIHDYKLVRDLRSEISALQTRLSDTRALCKLLNRSYKRGPISNETEAKINTEWARLITPYDNQFGLTELMCKHNNLAHDCKACQEGE